MMGRRVCAVLALACVRVAVDAGPSTHRKIALIRQRWDWKTASDEALTEWSIELRRYNMVDMELSDLVVRLSLILPVDPTTGEARPKVDESEVQLVREKAAKVETQLDGAAYDQHVADQTFSDMVGDSHHLSKTLSNTEKQALSDQHAQELKQSQDLSGSGHEALRRALAVLALFDQAAPSPLAKSAGTNATRAADVNSTVAINGSSLPMVAINGSSLADIAAARAAASPTVHMYNCFKDAVDVYREKRGRFAQEARRSKSKLIAVKSKLSKVDLHDE